MAQLTRKFLRGLGVEAEKINEIVAAHLDTLEAIRTERDSLRDASGRLAQAQDEVNRLTEALVKAERNGGDAARVQAEFDAYRRETEAQKSDAVKAAAVRRALRDSGVQREEFLELLMGRVDLASVEMEGGEVKNTDALVLPMKKAFSGCFAVLSDEGTRPQNPPTGGGTRMTREQIAKIANREERRAAIAANLDLYN